MDMKRHIFNLSFHIHVDEYEKTNEIIIKMEVVNKELVMFTPYMFGNTLLEVFL